MAGYSGKSVVQKLGIKPGFRIFVDGAPASYDDIIGRLPADVTIAPRLKAPLDMAHVFAKQAAVLRKKLPACREAIAPDGMVWVSWPKKSSGVVTDVTEHCAVARACRRQGLRDRRYLVRAEACHPREATRQIGWSRPGRPVHMEVECPSSNAMFPLPARWIAN
jgi:hypothetical protein